MRPTIVSEEKQKNSDKNRKSLEIKSYQELIELQAHFSELLTDLPAYKFSLAKIQQMYDSAIMHQQKFEQLNKFEQDLSGISLNQTQTLVHIKERELSMDAKLKLYRATSRDIMGKISRKKEEKLEIEKRSSLESFAMQKKLSLPTNRRKNILPTLTNLGIVYDITKLTESTDKRKRDIETLLASKTTRYKPLSAKERLISDLMERERHKTEIIEENSAISTKIRNCTIAAQILQTSRGLEHSPAETYNYLMKGIINNSNLTPDSTPEVDDGTIEKETELKMSYLETFNELFAAGKFLEASIQAANSPKGFLRTYEIVQVFTQATTIHGQSPPLMVFCQILLDTVTVFGPLTQNMSIACVNVLIEQGKHDLVYHAIFQSYLTLSNQLGYLLYSQYPTNPKFLSLAHHVFAEMNNRHMVASCLYMMGRPLAMFNYFREFQDDDFVSFLCHEPSLQKALLMLKPTNNYPPVIDLPNLLLLYIRNGIVTLSLQIFFEIFPETNPFSFGNQLIYDFQADNSMWEEIAGHFYSSGFTDIGERIFVSILSRHVIYQANNNY